MKARDFKQDMRDAIENVRSVKEYVISVGGEKNFDAVMNRTHAIQEDTVRMMTTHNIGYYTAQRIAVCKYYYPDLYDKQFASKYGERIT